MEQTSWPARRPLTIGLIGLGAALTWTALAFFFGSTNAHAAEDSEGLLGNLASTTTSTIGEVTGEVTEVTTQVAEVIAPVAPAAAATVQKATTDVTTSVTTPVTKVVASTPVVGPSVEPAKEAVKETVKSVVEVSANSTSPVTTTTMAAVTSVTTPVTHVLGEDPLTHIADSVLDSLEPMPIIGDAVAGLSPTVVFAVTTGDAILGSLNGLINSAIDPIAAIDVPGLLSQQAALRVADTNEARSVRGAFVTGLASVSLPASHASAFDRAVIDGSVVNDANGPVSPGTPLQPTSSVPATSAVSAGGSGGPTALITNPSSLSSLESARTVRAQNDTLPVSPSFGTDVSPD